MKLTSITVCVYISSLIQSARFPSLFELVSLLYKTTQDTPIHPRALRDSIICMFNMLYERVDDVLVLIYSVNVMWLYPFACIFSILE